MRPPTGFPSDLILLQSHTTVEVVLLRELGASGSTTTQREISAMRLKLSLLPPFKQSNVLIPVPGDLKTICDLKKYLRSSLSTVAEQSENWREIKLEIEGFELLGKSDINLIENGDIVW